MTKARYEVTTQNYSLIQSDLNDTLQWLTDEDCRIISVQCINPGEKGISPHFVYNWLVTIRRKMKL